MAYKGKFKPRNPNKYRGDTTDIVYRSSWELRFMSFLDNHKDILMWTSESVIIPYVSPIDNKIHRYYPDFLIKKKDKDGKIETVLIEIKPDHETKPPVVQNKRTKRYLNEVKTWGINSAKWEAAERYCKERGWKWSILTQNDLGIK